MNEIKITPKCGDTKEIVQNFYDTSDLRTAHTFHF